jgi:hypothetical protein
MTDKDKKNIYNAMVDLLSSYCDTCMDKHQKEKILMCAFKLELIEYAEKYAQADTEDLWDSIARTLGVSLENGDTVFTSKCNCSNGVCSLC